MSRKANSLSKRKVLKELFTDITINLSKPEKDPKEIARLKNAPASNYPRCLLCIENEGYQGTLSHPDRANHRMISLHLNHTNWMLQYSPYPYYNEHCILLSQSHEPMALTKNSFYNHLDFVKLFPPVRHNRNEKESLITDFPAYADPHGLVELNSNDDNVKQPTSE